MNILVCIKLIAQAQFTDVIGDSEERLAGGQLGINPADMYALELALRVKESVGNAIVTAVAMAPDCAEPSLREALAMGADRAVLINDARLAGSDTLATARVLAAAVDVIGKQDLIMCGKKAIDSETGHIGPQLSVLLSMPLATNVVSFSCDGTDIRFMRAGDCGMSEYSGRLPAVITVCNGVDMIRRPTIAGFRRARDEKVVRLTADDLHIDPATVGAEGSLTRMADIIDVSFRRGKNAVARDPDEGADGIMSLVGGVGNGASDE